MKQMVGRSHDLSQYFPSVIMNSSGLSYSKTAFESGGFLLILQDWALRTAVKAHLCGALSASGSGWPHCCLPRGEGRLLRLDHFILLDSVAPGRDPIYNHVPNPCLLIGRNAQASAFIASVW